MSKKHLYLSIIALAILNFSLIVYIRFIFPKTSHSPQSTQLTNQLINSSSPSPLPPSPTSVSQISNIQYQISLVLVGDIMLGREVDFQSRKKGNLYTFQNIMDITKNADLTFGNLESPFFEGCPETHEGYIFCARSAMIEGLLASGFDVLSIENNHILNYGLSGKTQTINLLTKNGIFPSTNQLINYSTNQLTIGFLSFDLTVNNNSTPVLQAITQSSPLVDVLIVSLHWGVEYEKTPRDWQVKLAHQIIDAGANIIVGHHPHVTQTIEEYGNGLIYYSLGNFIFDQMWSEETKKGMIAKITILPAGVGENKKIISHQEIPTYTRLIGQPEIVIGH